MASPALGTGRILFRATLIGTVLQLLLAISGHYEASVARLFAPAGMLVSFFAGLLCGRGMPSGGKGAAAVAGLVAGSVCALVGIAESYYLGDVPGWVLGFGPASSAVTGAVGGLLGRASRR